MSRATLLLAGLLGLGACSPSAGGLGPDGGGGDGGVTQGLVFPFTLTPALPADLGSSVTVTSVKVRLRSVRAIGDASAGDSRTYRQALELDWTDMQAPDPLVFADAPAGIYSRLDARLDGGTGSSFSIRGTVRVAGVLQSFKIEDEAATPLSIALGSIELKPGAIVTIPIELKLDGVLAGVDFTTLPSDDGALALETSNPQMAGVRAALLAAITAGSAR